MKAAARNEMAKLRAHANQLSITIEKQNRIIKAQTNAQRLSIKAQQDAIKMTKLHAATLLKQEKAVASTKERFLDFKEALKAAGGDSQVLARVTRSFNSLEAKMKKGEITTKEYTRTMIRFNTVLKQGQREVKKKADANRVLEKNLRGGKKELAGFNTGMTELTKSVQIALGPLSGVASRITAFSALLNTSSIIMAITAAAMIGLGVAVFKSINAFAKAEKQQFRIQALLAATGNVAGTSAKKIQDFARTLAVDTLTNAEKVRDAASALLTFRNIVGPAFEKTISLAQDMVAAFGGDLRTSTIQLAKALEDPIKGLTTLARIGVTFTDGQRRMVAQMVRTGRTAEAQGVIFDTLAGQIGGAGKAEGLGVAGAMDSLGDNLTELMEKFGELFPVKGFITTMGDFVKKMSEAIVLSQDFIKQQDILNRKFTNLNKIENEGGFFSNIFTTLFSQREKLEKARERLALRAGPSFEMEQFQFLAGRQAAPGSAGVPETLRKISDRLKLVIAGFNKSKTAILEAKLEMQGYFAAADPAITKFAENLVALQAAIDQLSFRKASEDLQSLVFRAGQLGISKAGLAPRVPETQKEIDRFNELARQADILARKNETNLNDEFQLLRRKDAVEEAILRKLAGEAKIREQLVKLAGEELDAISIRAVTPDEERRATGRARIRAIGRPSVFGAVNQATADMDILGNLRTLPKNTAKEAVATRLQIDSLREQNVLISNMLATRQLSTIELTIQKAALEKHNELIEGLAGNAEGLTAEYVKQLRLNKELEAEFKRQVKAVEKQFQME